MPRLKPDLMCEVLSMTIDFVEKSGMLFVPAGHCPDMGRTIALFKTVFPQIQSIETISGLNEDVKYCLQNNKWVAMERSR